MARKLDAIIRDLEVSRCAMSELHSRSGDDDFDDSPAHGIIVKMATLLSEMSRGDESISKPVNAIVGMYCDLMGAQ